MNESSQSSPFSGPDHDEDAARRARTRRTLAYAGGGVALLALAGGAIALVLSMDSAAPPTEVLNALNGVTSRYECARLGVEMDDARNVRVSGFVRSADDLKRLNEEVRAVPGVGTVEVTATEVIYPHCAVAILFGSVPPVAADAAPALSVQSGGDRLTVGTLMKLDLRNAPFDGYVHVDFYDRLGKVFHLLPGPAEPNNRLMANATMVLGEEKPGGRVYQVTEPLGQQVITVVSSREPLLQGERPEMEDAKDYLAALEPALKAAKPDALATTIKTVDIVAP